MKKLPLVNNLDMEKCATQIGNRFDLVLVAALRAKELRRGFRPLVNTPNGAVVTALQEIQEGLVGKEYLKRIK